MRLGEYVKQYREKHDLSIEVNLKKLRETLKKLRENAKFCGQNADEKCR